MEKRHVVVWFFSILIAIMCIAALAVKEWSSTHAVIGTVGSKVEIGLWTMCSPDATTFVTGVANNHCRYGHCTRRSTLVSVNSECLWGANDLCDRSKVSIGFMFFALFFDIGVIWCTLVSYLRTGWQQVTAALFLNTLSVAFCIVAWANWLTWQAKMNNDDTRTLPQSCTFDELSTSSGVGLGIAATVFGLINFGFLLVEEIFAEKPTPATQMVGNDLDDYDDDKLTNFRPSAATTPERPGAATAMSNRNQAPPPPPDPNQGFMFANPMYNSQSAV
eukprot:m.26347 g.26347  ORF g.26347 m.26347 type:complete len:276 (+) comp9911_c0_seq2:132-959(+)